MGRGFLDPSQRHPGVEGGGDERVAQGVRPDGLGDPGPARRSTDDPVGGGTVQAAGVVVEDDRSFAALTNRQVDGPGCAGGEER
jgi:hypothetical protein